MRNAAEQVELRFRRESDRRVELMSCVLEESAGEIEHRHLFVHLERAAG